MDAPSTLIKYPLFKFKESCLTLLLYRDSISICLHLLYLLMFSISFADSYQYSAVLLWFFLGLLYFTELSIVFFLI